MKIFPRFTTPFLGTIFAACSVLSSAGQTPNNDVDANAMLQSGSPGFATVSPKSVDAIVAAPQNLSSGTTLIFPAGALSSSEAFTAGASAGDDSAASKMGSTTPQRSARRDRDDDDGTRANAPTMDGIDTLATFAGAYLNQAGPSSGRVFPFIFMGNSPLAGGTTVIPAQMTTVSLQLLNADGTLNVNVPFTFRDLIEDSPNFATTNYRSGRHLQYADAVHRAQFFNSMGDDWHTVLHPHFVNDVTMTIPRFVDVTFPDGTTKAIQAYRVGTAPDGTHFVLMLNLLFNSLFDNQVISDINDGNFTTNAISMTLFPNTFLFSIDNTGKQSGCCVLGFHTYFRDTTVFPQPRWVTQYASWISPGLFGAGFQDVTALSHETAEAFADPFVNNATASWQFPGVAPTAKVCQGNLEEGDPIEVLANATIPITLRERHEVFTYHPQIIPLLQWFEMGTTSSAIDGAFSFPDETTLPHSALPCPQ